MHTVPSDSCFLVPVLPDINTLTYLFTLPSTQILNKKKDTRQRTKAIKSLICPALATTTHAALSVVLQKLLPKILWQRQQRAEREMWHSGLK